MAYPQRTVRVVLLVVLVALLASGCAAQSPTAPSAAPTPARFKALDEQTLANASAETQANFRAVYGDHADETWNLAHNQALIEAMDANAVLEASPNPVATRAWAGRTRVTFDTGSYVTGQVFVSVNGGPEKSFALAQRGWQEAGWIWRGSVYEFRLYAGTHREHLLRTLTVTRENDVLASIGMLPWMAALVLLVVGVVAGVVAGQTSIAAGVLTTAFAVVSAALALGVVLTTEPRSMDEQPFPDAHEYADAARHVLAGDGYVTTVHSDVAQPPRYPPGFSVMLVPFGATSSAGVLTAPRWFSAAYVLATVATAWSLGGPIAAGLAAALVGTAPFAIESASLLMSDAVVTALTISIAALLRRATPSRVTAAALLAGGLGLLRLSALIAVPAMLLAVPRAYVPRALAWVVPGMVALAVYQSAAFGSPLRTGYDYWLPDLRMFDVAYALQRPMGDGPTLVGDTLHAKLFSWLCPCQDENGPLGALPNALFYPGITLGAFWIFAPPLVGMLGLLAAFVYRREPAARFTLWLTLLSCLLLTFYVFQAARLTAAPAVLLATYAAVAIGRRLDARGL